METTQKAEPKIDAPVKAQNNQRETPKNDLDISKVAKTILNALRPFKTLLKW